MAKLRKVMVSSPIYPETNLKNKNAVFITNFDSTSLSPLISPTTPSISSSSSGGKISPAVLFTIVVLAAVLLISGLLHLLIRLLMKYRSSSSVSESNAYPELSESDTVQRQLQQLFHLHDSGLDQAYIDALPVFLYKEIMGLKEPFDCAVCLCEFTEQDKLRLLPNCSHAFHIDCIDTWLLSNSTCPLCRGTLFTNGVYNETPFFSFDDSRQEDGFSDHGEGVVASGHKRGENDIMAGKRVFSVRLGKFKSSNEPENGKGGEAVSEVGETSSSSLNARRCFSMGSYQYVVADLDLQVALRPSGGAGKGSTSLRIVKERGGQNGNPLTLGDSEGKKINFRSKGESFSVSKIWQWSRKGKYQSSSETHLASDSGGGCNSSVTVDLPWTDRSKGT